MNIDDEQMEARIENALGIIEFAFQDAFDNNDNSDLEDEIDRGIAELLTIRDEVMSP